MNTEGLTSSIYHPLDCGDGIVLPLRMNCPYYYIPHPLSVKAAEMVQSELERRKEWGGEIAQGKMFGVLVVSGHDGSVGYLKAFSGQLQGTFHHEGWVPPIFDFLPPDGYFRMEEKRITAINEKIALLAGDKDVEQLRLMLSRLESQSRETVETMRRNVALRKRERDIERERIGATTPEMIRESQFMKAELKRVIKAEEERLRPMREKLQLHTRQLMQMRAERKRRSEALQTWLFDNYIVINGYGATATLSELFRKTPQLMPPSGSGECCAPKLLNYALSHGMRPLALAEFWWGQSPQGLQRNHLSYYPACSGKCKPILEFMLQGVDVEPNPLLVAGNTTGAEVVYEDQWMMVVDKPSGMLSAPGKGSVPCVTDILLRERSDMDVLYNVNRLDMQTSGLLMLAKSREAQSALRRLFEERRVEKVYEAVLDGEYRGPAEGVISLPLSPDFIHRPCQKVDYAAGKEAITHYYILRVREGYTYLRLHPITGRTHQLRVHCAHHAGLALPIVGDTLYGTPSGQMMLRCVDMAFQHPFTGVSINLKVSSFDCI